MSWFNIKYRLHPWKEIEGINVPVYLNFGYPVLRFIDNGEYENSEIAIIKRTLESSDKVLELGTGLGFVSAFCSKQIGSERVYTFEGNSSLKPIINKLYNRNQVNPNLSFALLGEGNGSKIFYENKGSFLASSLKSTSNEGKQYKEVTELNLNEVIDQIKPNYLIMDIEGAEYDIFKIIDFQSINKIQFELHPSLLSVEQIDYIFEKLEKNGFSQNENFEYRDNFFFKRIIAT